VTERVARITLGLLGLVLAVGLTAWLAIELVACSESAERPAVDPPVLGTWQALPIAVVVSEGLEPCQRAGIRAALAWWEGRMQTRLWYVSEAAQSDAKFAGLIPGETVTVQAGGLSRPNALDDATVWFSKSDPSRLHSVDVRITGCEVRAFTHELGHALGFGDLDASGELMTRALPDGSYRVTDQALSKLVFGYQLPGTTL